MNQSRSTTEPLESQKGDEESNIFEEEIETPEKASTKRPIKRKALNESNKILVNDRVVQKAIFILEEPVEKEDKFDVFGKYIALQLRSLSERESEYFNSKYKR